MPRFCGVFGCTNKENKVKKSFFRLPAARKYIDPELTRLRRLKWLAAIRREDLTELKMKYLWICEDHFISGKPADLRDVNNPDWGPSIKMGYENEISEDFVCETLAKNFKNIGCMKEDNKTDRKKTSLLINGEISMSCSETLSFQGKLIAIKDISFQNTESFSSEIIPRTYSRSDKENANINLMSLQNVLFMKENFTYKNLLRNLSLIKKPNNFWGISPHSNVIICARWSENYTCEKRVVIENSLIIKVFLKEWRINLSELINVTCIDDISHLLEKVEGYQIS